MLGPLYKETGLLTFLICICLICRKSVLETEDYYNATSFNSQMEQIVGKLRTSLMPNLLQEGCTTVCFSQSGPSPYHCLFHNVLSKSMLLLTSPLPTPYTSSEHISWSTLLYFTPPPTLACLFIWELVL